MRKNLLIILLAVMVLSGCSTSAKIGQTALTGPVTSGPETLASIQCRCDSVGLNSPWVKFLRLPEPVTNLSQFDVLCKSEYPATVSINGQTLKQYKTGIFFTTVSFSE